MRRNERAARKSTTSLNYTEKFASARSPKAGLFGLGGLAQTEGGVPLFLSKPAPPLLSFALGGGDQGEGLLPPMHIDRAGAYFIGTATDPRDTDDFHSVDSGPKDGS